MIVNQNKKIKFIKNDNNNISQSIREQSEQQQQNEDKNAQFKKTQSGIGDTNMQKLFVNKVKFNQKNSKNKYPKKQQCYICQKGLLLENMELSVCQKCQEIKVHKKCLILQRKMQQNEQVEQFQCKMCNERKWHQLIDSYTQMKKWFIYKIRILIMYTQYNTLNKQQQFLIHHLISDKTNVQQDEVNLKELSGWEKVIYFFSEYLPIIRPNSYTANLWHTIIFLAICFKIFEIPVVLAFDLQHEVSLYYQIPVLLIFLFEMFISFNLGVFQQGQVVMERKIIRKNYLNNKFIIDVITTSFFFLSIAMQNTYLAIPFMYRMLQFYKIVEFAEDQLQTKKTSLTFLSILKLLILVFFVAHILACGFFFIAMITTKIDPEKQTWVIKNEYQDLPASTQYVNSLYFSFISMSTIGYGDISPQTTSERIYIMIISIISCGVFGYSLNILTQIFSEITDKNQEFRKYKLIVLRYMNQRGIEPDLQIRVLKSLEYTFSRDNEQISIQKTPEVFNRISKQLIDEVKSDFYVRILTNHQIFKANFSTQFLSKLAMVIHEQTYTPDEIIYTDQDQSDKIFFIFKGSVSIFTHNIKTQKQINIGSVQEGKMLCTKTFFANKKIDHSARSLQFSQVLFINKKDFLDIISNFLPDYERFQQLQEQLQLENVNSLAKKYEECSLCYNTGHKLQVCPYMHLHIDQNWLFYKYIHKNNKTVKHERQSFQRQMIKQNCFYERNNEKNQNSYQLNRTSCIQIRKRYVIENYLYYLQNEDTSMLPYQFYEKIIEHISHAYDETLSDRFILESLPCIVIIKEIEEKRREYTGQNQNFQKKRKNKSNATISRLSGNKKNKKSYNTIKNFDYNYSKEKASNYTQNLNLYSEAIEINMKAKIQENKINKDQHLSTIVQQKKKSQYLLQKINSQNKRITISSLPYIQDDMGLSNKKQVQKGNQIQIKSRQQSNVKVISPCQSLNDYSSDDDNSGNQNSDSSYQIYKSNKKQAQFLRFNDDTDFIIQNEKDRTQIPRYVDRSQRKTMIGDQFMEQFLNFKENQEIKSEDLWIEFDQAKIYSKYHPSYNYDKVIERYNDWRFLQHARKQWKLAVQKKNQKPPNKQIQDHKVTKGLLDQFLVQIKEQQSIFENNYQEGITVTQKQVQNIEIYYKQKENTENDNYDTETVYDVLSEQLNGKYQNIVYFLKERGEKLNIKEFNYCLGEILSDKNAYLNLVENNQVLLQEIFDKVPEIQRESSLIDFAECLTLCEILLQSQFIKVNQEKLWLEILNKLLKEQKKLQKEKNFEEASIFLDIYIKYTKLGFQKMQFMKGLFQMQKYIVQSRDFLSLQEMIDFMKISAKQGIYIDDTQLKQFDEIFEEQFKKLTPQQICDILQCYVYFNFQTSEIVEQVVEYFIYYLKDINYEILVQYLNYYQNKQEELLLKQEVKYLGYEIENQLGDLKNEKNQKNMELLFLTQKDKIKQEEKFIVNFNQFQYNDIQVQQEKDINQQILTTNIYFDQFVRFLDSFSKLKKFQDELKLWKKLEKMYQNFFVKVENYQFQEKINPKDIQLIIAGFDRVQQGSQKLWEKEFSSQNCQLLNVNFNHCYLVLKNLTLRFQIYDQSFLSLIFSYLIDENQALQVQFPMPDFQFLDKKEPKTLLEMYHVLFLNIYHVLFRHLQIGDFVNYQQFQEKQDKLNEEQKIEQQQRELEIQKQDKIFYLKSLKLLSNRVGSLLTKPEKKYKQFNIQQNIQLFIMFQMSQFMTGKDFDQLQEELFLFERNLLKKQVEMGSIDLSKLIILVENLKNEEILEETWQYKKLAKFNQNLEKLDEKLQNILVYFLQQSSEVELSILFGIFYKYNLKNEFIWSMLHIKLIELMENLSVTDLLIIVNIIMKIQPDFIDEEFSDLFLEILDIKAGYIHYIDLRAFINNFSCQNYDLGVKILGKLNEIQEEIQKHQEDIYDPEIQDAEYNTSFITRTSNITLLDVINLQRNNLAQTENLQVFIEQQDNLGSLMRDFQE